MAVFQSIVWLTGFSAFGYVLLKLITPDEPKYTKQLEELNRTGPRPPSGPLGFGQYSTANGREPTPIVPLTAHPFYRALKEEAAAAAVSKDETNSRKTDK